MFTKPFVLAAVVAMMLTIPQNLMAAERLSCEGNTRCVGGSIQCGKTFNSTHSFSLIQQSPGGEVYVMQVNGDTPLTAGKYPMELVGGDRLSNASTGSLSMSAHLLGESIPFKFAIDFKKGSYNAHIYKEMGILVIDFSYSGICIGG